MSSDITAVKAAVDAAFRDEWGRVVATLIRTTGDWDLAEECAQDAFTMALRRWPRDGIPGRPGAWLTTAARNRAVAVGMAQGPAAGLPLVAALEASGKLAGYQLLPATRADFLRRLGRLPEAAVAYREALELASTDAERRFLRRRLAEAAGQA